MPHKIKMPECESCGSDDCFACSICGKMTCRDCLILRAGVCWHSPYRERPNNWNAEKARLESRILELERALKRYGKHEQDCGPSSFSDPKEQEREKRRIIKKHGSLCDCGLTAVLNDA